jgi:hypothetical protein
MKLSGWTIVIIGLCLGLSAVAFALFQVYLPIEEAAAMNETYKISLREQAGKQKSAERRVQLAMDMVTAAARDWNTIVAQKTPSESLANGGINIFRNPYQLVVDTAKYRNNAQRAFNAQLHAGGVKVVGTAPEIPQPSDNEKDILAAYYNYPAFSFPVVLWELGSVTVSGTYQQITRNVRAWSRMPRYLAVVDGLRITGTSPNLTGTYNVTLVGFIHANKVFPNDARVAGGGSGTGGQGGAAPGVGTGGTGPGGGFVPSSAGLK